MLCQILQAIGLKRVIFCQFKRLCLLPSLISLGEGRGHICLYNPIHFSSGDEGSIALCNISNTNNRANTLSNMVQEKDKRCMLTSRILPQSMKGLKI
jgi:hypothetical protein